MDWIVFILAPLAIAISIVSIMTTRRAYLRNCERLGVKPLTTWQIITWRPTRMCALCGTEPARLGSHCSPEHRRLDMSRPGAQR